MTRLAFLLLVVSLVSSVGCVGERDRPQRKFVELVANQFEGASDEEIREVFNSCFREGDLISMHANVLATATATQPWEGGPTLYHWKVPGGQREGDILSIAIVLDADCKTIKHVMCMTSVK